MRVRVEAGGDDSNSCREGDRKKRAVVFVAKEPHPQGHDWNVLKRKN